MDALRDHTGSCCFDPGILSQDATRLEADGTSSDERRSVLYGYLVLSPFPSMCGAETWRRWKQYRVTCGGRYHFDHVYIPGCLPPPFQVRDYQWSLASPYFRSLLQKPISCQGARASTSLLYTPVLSPSPTEPIYFISQRFHSVISFFNTL
jgi:hypothetical protein